MKKNIQCLLISYLLFCCVGRAQVLPVESFKNMKARSIGPAVMSGRITCIDAVVSNPNVVYAGAASGGVWKSENGGSSWSPIFDDQPTLNIGSVAVQQSNPSVVWVGTGEGNPRNSLNIGQGIYKSNDAGKTWKCVGLEKTLNIHRILIDPLNSDVVYAGAIGSPFGDHAERGVFKTTDGGKNWEKILFTNEKSGVAEMVMDPANPLKIIVNMWQHRRTAWDFTSGGEGSGLYMTYDGGKTWKKLGQANNLPDAVGRCGLAISRSRPNRVYALVESTKNALYRSDDGGEKWEKINEKPEEVSNRPFYFNEIFCDPTNENRLYAIYQPITVSDDGGKSFKTIATLQQVHADHHALWINPNDPNLIYNGNDGGVTVSRDRGRTWVFADDIPVGQYYHVNVDNELPYNVYGGLQDNGSWASPAYTFTDNGLRNYYSNVVLYGDGFDVMPDPDDARFGYAMSQGGNLARYDRQTGRNVFIKPTHPDLKARLRFNWNAAIAQDPFDKATIYYGSQFVHQSTDKGQTWRVLSGDLTLNNPLQQKQDQSGGLTLDVTSAENHNTILTIAPSTKEKGVLWVGTDDGNVQLTRDGGKTWSNLTPNIAGLPKEAWIPQITASRHNAGEAFVVANHYRAGTDFAPYVFRTTDYGQTWTRLVDDKKVNGYALCFLQDPSQPNLQFCGTEHGLFVSIDNGQHWAQWKHGIPSVSTMDLAIQEREADLVIATFGRALYVLDNIRPLRALAASAGKAINQKITVFEPTPTYLASYKEAPGYMNTTDDLYEAENRAVGGIIDYFLGKPAASVPAPAAGAAPAKSKNKTKMATSSPPADSTSKTPVVSKTTKKDTVFVAIFDEMGKQIRTLTQLPDSTLGAQRLIWNLSEKGTRQIGSAKPKKNDPEPQGSAVLPGIYKLVFKFAGGSDSTFLTVKADPRLAFDAAAETAKRSLQARLNTSVVRLTEATDRLAEAQELTDKLSGQLKDKEGNDFETLRKSVKSMQDSLKVQREFIMGKTSEKQGYGRPFSLTATSKLQEARMYVAGKTTAPTATETTLADHAELLTKQAIDRVNGFFSGQWASFRQKIEAAPLGLFKDYAPIK